MFDDKYKALAFYQQNLFRISPFILIGNCHCLLYHTKSKHKWEIYSLPVSLTFAPSPLPEAVPRLSPIG